MMKISQKTYMSQKNILKTIIPNLFIVSLCTMISTFGLTACGQKGMLYIPNSGETVLKSSVGHKQDDFIVPTSDVLENEQEIQQRIEKMKADPNDY